MSVEREGTQAAMIGDRLQVPAGAPARGSDLQRSDLVVPVRR